MFHISYAFAFCVVLCNKVATMSYRQKCAPCMLLSLITGEHGWDNIKSSLSNYHCITLTGAPDPMHTYFGWVATHPKSACIWSDVVPTTSSLTNSCANNDQEYWFIGLSPRQLKLILIEMLFDAESIAHNIKNWRVN